MLVANTCAQNISVDAGAVENIRLPRASTPNPVEGVAVSCGCCMTPFNEITSCAALLISVSCIPSPKVGTNFVLTPSNARVNV